MLMHFSMVEIVPAQTPEKAHLLPFKALMPAETKKSGI
ncbi:hypothetical protein [Salmonella phage S106]|nr:hypothetical protein [Salmonella phage S106]AXC39957.1 hypothetical protein [Salmonella phage S111]